jgi:hypothetical protein
VDWKQGLTERQIAVILSVKNSMELEGYEVTEAVLEKLAAQYCPATQQTEPVRAPSAAGGR